MCSDKTIKAIEQTFTKLGDNNIEKENLNISFKLLVHSVLLIVINHLEHFI